MNDMRATIIPKSDQLNSDDLISGPRTITINSVAIRPGTEQPVSLSFDGDDGKPYKPCKSMCRVMVHLWGPDANAYVGRSMTLYRDPKVLWGGMAVGGIRISAMTDIKGTETMMLTESKKARKPFTVNLLKAEPAESKPAQQSKARKTIREMIEALPDRAAVAGFLADGTDAKKAFDKLDAAKQEAVRDMLADQMAKFLAGPTTQGPDDDRFPADIPFDDNFTDSPGAAVAGGGR